MTQPAGVDFRNLDLSGSQSDVLRSLKDFLEQVAENRGSDSEGSSNEEVSLDGEFSIVGDPHISGTVEVDGEEVTFDYTTEGGNGDIVNLLDTDTVDIRGKFETLTSSDGKTYVTEEAVTFGEGEDEVVIDADDDSVTLNGKEIEDGVHHVNGNTITKSGDKVTIETADGQKIVIEDKGDYLDTKVTLADYESEEIGGMIGDALKGNANNDAEDYEYSADEEDSEQDSSEQDSEWTVQLLETLAERLETSDPELSEFLSALAKLIEGGSSGSGSDSEEVSLDGEFSIVGDPHISGTVEVDGEEVTFDYTTEGGNGEVIDLLDTDTLDIRGKFETLTSSDGKTYVTEETVTFGEDELVMDADDDTVTLNGEEIEDGVHHVNGNTITKEGDTVTIKTADGQKIVIEDKGDYLDTKVTLDDYESEEIGGMIGDALEGNANNQAEDYEYSADEEEDSSEQDSEWVAQLLETLAERLETSDPELSEFLSALAKTIESGSGSGSDSGSEEVSLDGEFSIVGDPHISGTVEVDGEEVTFDYTTEGGNGDIVNLLDTDTVDIRGKFETLTSSDGKTYVTEEAVTFGEDELVIDADDDTVTLNGEEIEDGVHHVNGNTITKSGDKVTIETADGQKIVIEDKGDYLDTKVTLADYESEEIGGMIGDALKGNANNEAEDYEYSADEEDSEQDSEWAADLLESLAEQLETSDPELSEFLSTLANFIEQSQSGRRNAA